MDEFSLIKPQIEYREQIASYKEEFIKNHESMDGTGPLLKADSVEDFITTCRMWENKETVPEGLVCATQFLFIRKRDNKLVGMIQVRHSLNDFLKNFGGNIGYSVRKSERRKGYAKLMLKEALSFCKTIGLNKVLISCIETNIPSEKTIISCGGVYENTVYEPSHKTNLKRFWVTL